MGECFSFEGRRNVAGIWPTGLIPHKCIKRLCASELRPLEPILAQIVLCDSRRNTYETIGDAGLCVYSANVREMLSSTNSLDVEGGGAVIGIDPGVEFQIIEGGVFWIEADYDWFTNGQFACGEVASFWFGGEILVPGSGETTAIGIVKFVG